VQLFGIYNFIIVGSQIFLFNNFLKKFWDDGGLARLRHPGKRVSAYLEWLCCMKAKEYVPTHVIPEIAQQLSGI
jgi:hypothetical protein